MKKLLGLFLLLHLLFFSFSFSSNTHAAEEILETAIVTDAQKLETFLESNEANSQQIEIKVNSGKRKNVGYDVVIQIPNAQVVRPLKVGDIVIVRFDPKNQIDVPPIIIGLYRQNNVFIMLIFTVSILGLTLYNAYKFRFFFILLVYLLTGITTLILFKTSMLNTIIATILVSSATFSIINYRIFKKLAPNLFLLISYISGLFLTSAINFILVNLNIFDSNLFQIFVSSDFFRSNLTAYLFSIMVLSPVFLYMSNIVILKSIVLKSDNFDITRIKLISLLIQDLFKEVNLLITTLGGIIISMSFIIVAPFIGPGTDILLTLNNYAFTQLLGFFIGIIFSIILFIPLLSLICGSWFGNIESHKLVDDKNYSKFQ